MTPSREFFRRSVLAATLVAACLVAATGCSTNRGMLLPYNESRDEKASPAPDKTWIVGYTTRDGRHHKWEGTVQPVGTDSLLFVQDPVPVRGDVTPRPGNRFTLAKTDVKSLKTPKTTTSMLAVAALGALILVTTVIAGSAASWE